MSTVTGSMETKGTLTQKAATTSVLGLGLNANINTLYKYTSGTGALQVDVLYANEMSLTAPVTIDLTAIASNPFARVREIVVICPDADAGEHLKVSRGSSNGWSQLPTAAHALVVAGGDGYLRLSDPNSTGSGVGMVVDSTHKTILLDPGSAPTLNVGITVVGCSVE